jgi:hypothetical protein
MKCNCEKEAATDSLKREHEASAERFRGRIRCAVPSRWCDQMGNSGWSSAGLGFCTCAPTKARVKEGEGRSGKRVPVDADLGTVIDAINRVKQSRGRKG